MKRSDSRKHRIVLTYARPPVVAVEAWSYQEGAVREFHVAMLNNQGRTVGQARFRIRNLKRRRDA